MAIQTACEHCNREYTLADTVEGKKVRCKSCGEIFTATTGGKAQNATRSRGSANGSSPKSQTSRSKIASSSTPPPASARKRDRDDSLDFEEEDSRPRKKRSRGMPIWIWLVGGGAICFLFLVCAGGGAALYFGGFLDGMLQNRVTKENFDKIKRGMSETEVRAILGSPSQVNDATTELKMLGGRNPFGSIKVLVWKGGGNTIQLTLMNDKVTARMFIDPNGAKLTIR